MTFQIVMDPPTFSEEANTKCVNKFEYKADFVKCHYTVMCCSLIVFLMHFSFLLEQADIDGCM